MRPGEYMEFDGIGVAELVRAGEAALPPIKARARNAAGGDRSKAR